MMKSIHVLSNDTISHSSDVMKLVTDCLDAIQATTFNKRLSTIIATTNITGVLRDIHQCCESHMLHNIELYTHIRRTKQYIEELDALFNKHDKICESWWHIYVVVYNPMSMLEKEHIHTLRAQINSLQYSFIRSMIMYGVTGHDMCYTPRRVTSPEGKYIEHGIAEEHLSFTE